MPNEYYCDCGYADNVGGKCPECGMMMMRIGADEELEELPAVEKYSAKDFSEEATEDIEESLDDGGERIPQKNAA